MYVPTVPYVKVQATEEQRLEYARSIADKLREEEFMGEFRWFNGRAIQLCNKCHKGFGLYAGLCGSCYSLL